MQRMNASENILMEGSSHLGYRKCGRAKGGLQEFGYTLQEFYHID